MRFGRVSQNVSEIHVVKRASLLKERVKYSEGDPGRQDIASSQLRFQPLGRRLMITVGGCNRVPESGRFATQAILIP